MSARVFKDTDFLDAAPSVRTFSEDDFTDTPTESPTRLDLSKVNYERQGYYYPGPGQQGAFDPNTADLTTPPVGRPGVIPTDPNDAARIAGTPQAAGIEDIAAAVPFLGGAKQALDSAALKEAVLRVKAGTHTPSDLQTLKRFQMDSARGTTFGKDIAAGVAGSARLGGQAAIGSIAGPVGSAAGMLLDPGTIVSRYNAQTTPEVKFDDAGGVTIGESPSKTKDEALKKVAALQTSDAVIGMFGGKAVAGAMGIGGRALGKVAGKYLPETSAAVKAVAKRYGDNTAANLLQRGQIQGIIPEYMEEVMQSVANYNIGEPGQDPKALLDPTNPEALKTALVIGILNSPRLAGMLQKRKDDTPAPPSSDASANVVPTGDMNLTLTPEQPVTQSDVADIFAMFDEPAAQPAAGAPTPPVARRTPDTLPPLPPGATIPVQGTPAPPAQQPTVAPIAPGSAVMRPVPTLTPEEVQAWSEEADALAPGEQEIVADYLMQNPGNPEQLSPREIVARGRRDVWRMTPDEQAQYEQAMGLNEQPAEATAPAQPQETTNEEVQGQGRQEEVAPPTPTPRGRKAKQAPVTPVEATTPETTPTPAPPAMEAATAPPAPISPAVEPAKRPAPPRKGSTSPTGWSTVAKGVARKDIEGSTVEIVRQADGSWSVTRDEKEMDAGYKSRAEAEKYADGELAQDMRDQRNASEEDQAGQGRGPAPADTGIFRDLTAAAREGKRFVEALHTRIAPVLARIHAAAKSPVEFIRAAVAKIGEHIRPYAKRFIAEVKRGVRATNAEFRQNPTRGSVPIEGKSSEQAPMAKAPKGEQTRASGLAQGQREGVNRQRSDLKAMFALAKEVLPPDEWKAIAKTGRKIANIKGKSEAAQRRALNRILERKMGEIEHARALKSAKESIKKARKGFKKLRPEVQAVIDEVLRGKRVKGVSQAAYDRMLQLVAEVTAGTRTGVSPATLARASKAISDFENPDLQDMKDMTAEELSGIADQIEQALQLNDSLNEGLAAERERQKALNKQAPKEVEARAPIALQNIAFENSILRSISEGTLSLSNIVRGIVGKGGHVFKTLVSDLVEADTKTIMYLRKHTEMTMARLREAGITPDKLAAMSRTLNPKAGEVEVAGVKMTKGERISLLLHLADPNTRASLLNPKSKGFEFSRAESGPNRTLKVTEEVARAIEESATPDERTVASIFWDWANGDLRDDVNEWSRRVLGYDMFTSDQHWNRRRKITDGEPAVGLLAGDFNTAQQEAGAYLKERTGGTSPIVVDDAFQHFSSHVNATSALMGKFEASVNARRLLATNEFQQAIKKNRRTGDQLFSSINKRINDWGSIAPPKSNDRLLGAVRWLGRRYSAAKLSVNLPVIISQPFSILSAAKVIPMKHITKAILGGETVHESVKREIADTPEAADLHYIINGGGHHVVTPGSITGTTAGQIFGTEKDSPLEKSMVLIQRGNNVAVSGIWRAAKAWGREQGLTGDELMKFTAKTARDAWLQTQPSNSSVYHPGLKISARTNSVAYAMTMFQGQTSIQFQDAIDAIRDYQELPAAQQTAAEKAKVLAKAARPIVLQAILFYGLKYGMEKTWEELFGRSDSKKKSDKKLDPAYDKLLDIAKSPVTSIPGIGPVIDGVIDFAKRKATGQATFGAAFDNPVVDAAGNITGFPGHLLEAAQAYKKGKEIPMSAIRGMLSAGEAVTGLPINNLRGWVEGIDRAVRDKR